MNQQQPATAPDAPLKTYRVTLQLWKSYIAYIDAASPAEARGKAVDMYIKAGVEDFEFEDSDLDEILATEWE